MDRPFTREHRRCERVHRRINRLYKLLCFARHGSLSIGCERLVAQNVTGVTKALVDMGYSVPVAPIVPGGELVHIAPVCFSEKW